MPGARSLALSPDARVLFVGTRLGSVYKVSLSGQEPEVVKFQENLNGSNGVCFYQNDLIVGELLRVRRFSAEKGFPADDPGRVILEGLPNEKHHGWRYLRTGPDGRIRISIGAPCNVCERPDDKRFGSICSFTGEGEDFRVESSGIRNSVGFDWEPESGDFYFTDNGRDLLGDDLPPCELNRRPAGHTGGHYGFPYRYGDNQPDPDFEDKAPEIDFRPPFVGFGAHVAPLGCYFPKGVLLKKSLPRKVLVAQHGSWNRSTPSGYRAVTVDLESRKVEPFLWGFLNLEGQRPLSFGRPVDFAELPDGTLLVSDDQRGVIWSVRVNTASEPLNSDG